MVRLSRRGGEAQGVGAWLQLGCAVAEKAEHGRCPSRLRRTETGRIPRPSHAESSMGGKGGVASIPPSPPDRLIRISKEGREDHGLARRSCINFLRSEPAQRAAGARA